VALDGLATGIPIADALIAGRVRATGRGRWQPDRLLIERLDLEAGGARLQLATRLAGERAAGTATIALPRLGPLARAVGAPVVNGALTAEIGFDGTLDTMSGRVAVDGTLDRQRVKLAGRFARTAEAIQLDGLSLTVGGAELQGRIRLAGGLADGTVEVRAADLAGLAPLLGTELRGRLAVAARLTAGRGKQGLDATVTGGGLAGAGHRGRQPGGARRADRPARRARRHADRQARGPGERRTRVDRAELEARGSLADLAVKLGARGHAGAPFRVDLAAAVSHGAERDRLVLQRLTALVATIPSRCASRPSSSAPARGCGWRRCACRSARARRPRRRPWPERRPATPSRPGSSSARCR